MQYHNVEKLYYKMMVHPSVSAVSMLSGNKSITKESIRR